MAEVALRLETYDWSRMPAPDELFERAGVIRAQARELRRESATLRAAVRWEKRRLHRTRRQSGLPVLHWLGPEGLDDILV